ncbi:hypothetical protein AgCh_024055 [Apium graveolens]
MWAKGKMSCRLSFRVLAGVLLLMSFLLRDLENQFVQLSKRRDEFMQILIDEVRGSGNEGEAKTLTQVLLDLNEAKPDYYKDDVIMSLMQCFNLDRISEEMVDMTEGHGLFAPKVVTLKAKCAARPSMYAKEVDDLIQFGTSGNVAGFICEAIQELVVLLNWLQVTCLRYIAPSRK